MDLSNPSSAPSLFTCTLRLREHPRISIARPWKIAPQRLMNLPQFPRLIVLLAITFASGTALAADGVSFSRQIQPLLAKRCFACHGPDKAEGGLRLHTAEARGSKLESGNQAVVAGKLESSELVRRITSADPDERMPPGDKGLSAEEITLLKTWIESGAKSESHWAFEPVGKPEVPAVKDTPWVRNPIDAFILAKLEAAGLKPAAAASPRTLLRRVHHDLTGLPPSAAELDQFEAAMSQEGEAAYVRVIDRLLESPHYGERWARHWLDVVRYADTNSFERDGDKPFSWRYRDYVIRSLNEDKPYDQFLREQLAGDELPNPSADAIIATAFYRLGLWDDEPVDRELAMYDGFDDILTTVGQGLFGLTLNCARCHDHKIDPVPQRDYYSLLAFFRNITPNGNENPQTVRPIFVESGDQARFEKSQAELKERQNGVQAKLMELESEFRSKIENLVGDIEHQDLDDIEARFYRDTWEKLPDFDQLKAETVSKLERPYFDIRSATRPDFFGFVFVGTLKVPADGSYTFTLDSDDGSRLLLDGKDVLKHDGQHAIGQPKSVTIELKQGRLPIRLEYFQHTANKGLSLQWSGPGFAARYLSATTAAGLDLADLRQSGGRRRNMQDLLRKRGAEILGNERFEQVKALQKELDTLKRTKPWNEFTLCVTEHGKNAPETFVLGRGNPQSRGDKVTPAFLTALGGGVPDLDAHTTEANSSGRRLAFATWATDPEHRLTTRVIANRLWQHHFGRGIVRSPNNFGQLGDPPTHPELLDWLARELVRGGWRLKALHKTMLLSNTYRQSSAGSDQTIAKDPANDWFGRFNLRRVGAEELRDSVLVASGTFNPKMFGPGIYIDLSQEVLAGQSVPGKGWGRSSPEEQARRSIYIHVKRSLIPPILASFDFPDTDTTCEARFITTQPAQSLALLNGDWINQQASLIAKRLEHDAPNDPAQQMQLASRWILGRSATPAELAEGRTLIDKLRNQAGQDASISLANYCLYLLNLNEFLYID